MPVSKASDIMDRSELTFSDDITVGAAIQKLLKTGLNGAPVVDAEGRLCGMLTEKDCLTALVRQAVDGLPQGHARDYMTTEVATVSPSTGLLDVAYLFLKNPFRKLPVVDADGRVVGQVSRRDVLRSIESAKENPFLYGREDHRPSEMGGVHSAMERARGKS